MGGDLTQDMSLNWSGCVEGPFKSVSRYAEGLWDLCGCII